MNPDFVLQDTLLQKENNGLYAGDGSVDLQGRPVLKSKTGTWRASFFIIGNECAEHLAYYGIATNLVSYLSTKLHEGNNSAARNVTTWSGTCYLMPLVGAFFADAYWGRYWTIAVFSIIYFIGMCTLTLSASVPTFTPAECVGLICPSATPAQYAVFFLGLYLIALGAGGIKPCVSAFGADQFDDTDPVERVKKGSFFNWFYFSIQFGSLISSSLLVWIQENVGWGVGFAIPTLSMGMAVVCFLLGTPLYRFQRPSGSPLTRLCQVIVASLRKWKVEVPQDSSLLYETSGKHSAISGTQKLAHSDGLTCLDKASVISDADEKSGNFSNPWKLCTITQVEELKIWLRMLPVCAATISYSAVYAQVSTTFVEQGKVMDRRLGLFTIPAASLSILEVSSGLICVLTYEKILVPIARKYTGKERGVSELQRMGVGLILSILSMVCAAMVEIKRLQLAKELGLEDENVAVPLSIFWQIPQFFFVGAADVFTFVGKMEFFYNQSPETMRSLCSALALVIASAGNYLNSLILTIVAVITTSGGNTGWIPDNLNKGHLDNYFLLWAGLGFLNIFVYVLCAMKYKPKKTC